jgi:hypothetical protein
VVIVPHPFDPLRRSPLKRPALERLAVAGLVDAIEILNARMALKSHNLRGAEFAARMGLPGTAGSDAHSRPEYAHAWLEIAPFTTPAEFLANLPTATIGGNLSPFFVHLLSTVAKRRKKIDHWRTERRTRIAAARLNEQTLNRERGTMNRSHGDTEKDEGKGSFRTSYLCPSGCSSFVLYPSPPPPCLRGSCSSSSSSSSTEHSWCLRRGRFFSGGAGLVASWRRSCRARSGRPSGCDRATSSTASTASRCAT